MYKIVARMYKIVEYMRRIVVIFVKNYELMILLEKDFIFMVELIS